MENGDQDRVGASINGSLVTTDQTEIDDLLNL